eukprot:CAMPEP_0113908626 /NCGR_PEP_ID=MMETSP0780_2-20120614/26289_1 /TAXON_ID=652834 /ORGANISM="Palpitomonas bilix" /LENGTH=299 /DNA_ID=CAMNT_0000904121 /DNA_START=220 /DNA_END=1119 /DNA_ORIENTATION=+ /assembly_acc=CAM_ASM_000599
MKEHFILDGLFEFRGSVFSIGGDGSAKDGDYTLPNFFEQVNGFKPAGASEGKSLPLDAIKFEKKIIQLHDAKVAKLNGAVSMAQVQGVPEQVDYLVGQLKQMPGVDMENDWKLLTILIGANNLCVACENGKNYSNPDNYKAMLNQVLEQVHENIPRVFVNLMSVFNISQVHTWDDKSRYCETVHKYVDECPCLEKGDAERQTMDEYAVYFNQRLEEIESEWAAKAIPDFHVSLQPGIRDLEILDLGDLSGVDCFHPSKIADSGFALALWNNMWTPPGQKSTTVDWSSPFKCPTADTLLQ